MRDVRKYAAEGEKKIEGSKLNITVGELCQIRDIYRVDAYDALVITFCLGVESGLRLAKKKKSRKKRG